VGGAARAGAPAARRHPRPRGRDRPPVAVRQPGDPAGAGVHAVPRRAPRSGVRRILPVEMVRDGNRYVYDLDALDARSPRRPPDGAVQPRTTRSGG
jgi:hypothetical protein